MVLPRNGRLRLSLPANQNGLLDWPPVNRSRRSTRSQWRATIADQSTRIDQGPWLASREAH
jgi:hypothetical protein